MKKGYFFTLDAFIAISIMVICVILLFSIHSAKPYPLQSIFISDDMMYYLSNTKCYELQDEYVMSLIDNGSISMPDTSLLEQITIFYINGRGGFARNLSDRVVGGMMPSKYGVEMIISNSTDKYTHIINRGDVSSDDSRLLISSKKMVFGMINQTGWGPMVAEVRLWQ